MPSRRRLPPVLPLAALVLLAPAGCGGGDEPTAAATRTATVTHTVTVPATSTATGATPAPDPNAPLSLQMAERTLDARGYAPLTERDFRPGQPLKVLVGIERGDGPRAELAFFFVGDRFIGTDTQDPSAHIDVTAQQDEAITLTYALYRPGDAIDAPSAGSADVTYAWDGSRLVPRDPIPSADPAASPSRR
ncbi:MAG: LppP/LprE family lipoprotein [Conexibacter sp.]